MYWIIERVIALFIASACNERVVIFVLRATVIIKCDMDFVLYPLDVQECAVDFSSCELWVLTIKKLTFYISSVLIDVLIFFLLEIIFIN